MSDNFRRFNQRIGVVFEFQEAAANLFAWETPSHTLSFLAVFTFACLDPYLIFSLPIFVGLLGVLIPSFLARHPAPPKGTLSSEQSIGYTASGPPTAPPATYNPVKELSKDFFKNMRDLQNSMGDFVVAHDQIVALVPLANFSDEALSSAVFLFLFIGGIVMTITAHIMPWRFAILFGGWAGVCSAHPTAERIISIMKAEYASTLDKHEDKAKTFFDNWVATDVILDSAPETREVEIFELQHRGAYNNLWEAWLFSPSPYDPLSPARLADTRPHGSRFFEDIKAPDGWEWSEKKWALDLWSREWVEERIITGVEVETEGERWVYDMYQEPTDLIGVVDEPDRLRTTPPMPQATWEEGDDITDPRGEWRRRRWVRLVKRKAAPASFAS